MLFIGKVYLTIYKIEKNVLIERRSKFDIFENSGTKFKLTVYWLYVTLLYTTLTK